MAAAPYHHDRIRIGYLSSDFRDHPVAAQLAPLLEGHDRARFEVFGLSTGRADDSSKYHRIIKACDRFCDIGPMGSRQAAAFIRQAEIDIVIDLNGHTLGWRPAILKYRPAPVSAAFLGYAGTTGADFIDYIIGDAQVTPFDLAPAMREKIVQLPGSFWPTDPMLPEPEAVSRAQAGLPSDAFVFCCFNASHKIRPDIFDIWMRLLASVSGSVLWLRDERLRRRMSVSPSGKAGAALITGACSLPVAPTVLPVIWAVRRWPICLWIAFPYTAHATASDALVGGAAGRHLVGAKLRVPRVRWTSVQCPGWKN